MQACDSEEDGLFGFDLHSDGDGQRYMVLCPFLFFQFKIFFITIWILLLHDECKLEFYWELQKITLLKLL